MSKPLTLNRTVAWFNKTEGRDKICKTLQYGSRLIMWHLANKGHKDASAQFQALFKGMQQSRKLFRLAKTLNEIQSLIEIINNKSNDDFGKLLKTLQRVAFGLYWVFDNIAVLTTIKFINRDPKSFNKAGMTFWFLALIFGLVLAIRDYVVLQQSFVKLKATSILDQQESQALKYADLKKKEIDLYLTFLKTLGDLVPSSQGSEIFPKVFGKSFNDGQIGFGGLLSGVIAAYQAY